MVCYSDTRYHGTGHLNSRLLLNWGLFTNWWSEYQTTMVPGIWMWWSNPSPWSEYWTSLLFRTQLYGSSICLVLQTALKSALLALWQNCYRRLQNMPGLGIYICRKMVLQTFLVQLFLLFLDILLNMQDITHDLNTELVCFSDPHWILL